MTKNNNYSADSIIELPFPSNVRKRPTMYIGQLGVAGNTHLAKEIIDNSVDEYLAGYGKEIDISICNSKGYCKVKDHGRGIPKDAVVKSCTVLHSSGKFDHNSYQSSGGLNGVGSSCTNALSKIYKVTTIENGYEYKFNFEKGIIKAENVKGEKTSDNGTTVVFYPDEEVMEETTFNISVLKDELEMKSYVNGGLKFNFKDVDNKEIITFYHKNGLAEYIKDKISKKILCDPIVLNYEINSVKNKEPYIISVEITLAWQNTEYEEMKGFCNSLYQAQGGSHVAGCRLALTNVIKKYITDNNMLTKKDANLEIQGDDVRAGLIALVSCKHPDPQFDSQTKDKITNKDLQGAVQKTINEEFTKWFDSHSKEAKIICNKIITSAKAREAAKKAKDLVTKKGESTFNIVSDISKLATCISKNPEERELFIVEGQSAGGSAKKCRNRQFQSVYSLRGKPLNSNNLQALTILENKEYADLTCIVTGEKNGLDDNFKIEKLQYHKVIIMADADVDGLHIQSLLVTHNFKHMYDIIKNGHLYIALPPLYRITLQGGKYKYFLNDDEYNIYINSIIFKSYKFVINDKALTSEKNVNTMIDLLSKYYNYVHLYSMNNGINEEFIDKISNIYRNNIDDYPDLKSFSNLIKANGDFKLFKNSNGKAEFSGLYKSEFVNEEVSVMFKMVKEVVSYMDSIKLPKNVTFEGKGIEDDLISTNYKNIIDNATPKSRVRMKGLGEMDAQELWDTTMDPDKRSLIQVTVEDYNKAFDTMEDLMNGNAKYADRRKSFILKNQDKANNIDV